MPKAELYPHLDGSLRVTTALAADYITLRGARRERWADWAPELAPADAE